MMRKCLIGLLLVLSGCSAIDRRVAEVEDHLDFFKTHQIESPSAFSPVRMRLVDRKGKAFLMRGKIPLYRDPLGFAYPELMEKAKELIGEGKEAPIGTPRLIVVSLLNHFTENVQIRVEREFFARNPAKGRFINIPLFGAPIGPEHFPKEIDDAIDDYMVDDLPEYVMRLKALLNENKEIPTVIYVHCQAGKDRTGELIGAYMMQEMGVSLERFLEINQGIVNNREISVFSENQLRWFEHLLKRRTP